MLKIKDNVDLKELEKYGFKPKYDEDTGELIEYWKEFLEAKNFLDNTISFYIKKENRLFSKKIICSSGTWNIFNHQYGEQVIDLIYDLIKADLVEKVDE